MTTLLHKLEAIEEFTTFCAALRKTRLANMLAEPGAFTVFAPTNDAFDNFPPGAVNRLLGNREKLTAILSYHIVPGVYTTSDAARLSSSVTSLEGSDLRISTSITTLTVNGARVVKADIVADNGAAHGIDQVLAPLDDLGNVEVDYEDVVVLTPKTMVVLAPVVTSARGRVDERNQEFDEQDDLDM